MEGTGCSRDCNVHNILVCLEPVFYHLKWNVENLENLPLYYSYCIYSTLKKYQQAVIIFVYNSQIYFKEFEKTSLFFFLPNICHLYWSFIFLYNFPSLWKAFFSDSFRAGLWAVKISSYFMWECLYFIFLLRDVSMDVEIWVDGFFFQFLNITPTTSSGLKWFLMRSLYPFTSLFSCR